MSLSPSAMTLGLGNMRDLMARLGRPHERFGSILVAGTNGKGTVTVLLSSLLEAGGKKVGRFVSPHVYSPAERIAIDGVQVGLDEMERAAARLVPLHEETGFSYFEGLTALAFLLFAEREVDYAVLEVGLGGRFDATNVVEPVLSIITSISLDHRRLLGDSEEEILREKLGVARPGIRVLCGGLSEELKEYAGERARRDGFELVFAEELGRCTVRKLDFDSMTVSLETVSGDYGEVSIPFPGLHNVENLILAVGGAEMLIGRLEQVGEALSRAYLPGRFESIQISGKRLVLDVAHNDAALAATLDTFSKLCDRRRAAMVFGMMRRKELVRFPGLAVGSVCRIFLAGLPDHDACSAQELLARFGVDNIRSTGVDVILLGSSDDRRIETLFERLLSEASPFETILVTGSHRTVQLAGRTVWRRKARAERVS